MVNLEMEQKRWMSVLLAARSIHNEYLLFGSLTSLKAGFSSISLEKVPQQFGKRVKHDVRSQL